MPFCWFCHEAAHLLTYFIPYGDAPPKVLQVENTKKKKKIIIIIIMAKRTKNFHLNATVVLLMIRPHSFFKHGCHKINKCTLSLL